MYDVTVEASFSASHQLRLPGGQLEPLHGHDWKIEARFEGPELNDWGVLVDFADVESALVRITRDLHHNLNELKAFAIDNPSAENVARYVFDRLQAVDALGDKLVSVRVREAPGCVGGYAPQNRT